jgi:F-type H+-transporting ATPase subunit b
MLQDPSFWVAVGFVIFIIVTFKPVSAKVSAALDDRAVEIKKNLDDAQKLREEAQAALANYQRLQRDALQEAEGIIAHAVEEAARLRETAGTDLVATLKRREEQAVEKIAQAEARAAQDVRNQAVDLAMAATSKLLDENVTDGVRARLAADAITDLPSRLQ